MIAATVALSPNWALVMLHSESPGRTTTVVAVPATGPAGPGALGAGLTGGEVGGGGDGAALLTDGGAAAVTVDPALGSAELTDADGLAPVALGAPAVVDGPAAGWLLLRTGAAVSDGAWFEWVTT